MFTVEVVAFKSIRVLKAVPLNMMTSSTLAAHQHTSRRAGYRHRRRLTKELWWLLRRYYLYRTQDLRIPMLQRHDCLQEPLVFTVLQPFGVLRLAAMT